MHTILKALFALFIPLAALYAQVIPGAATATLKEAYIPLPGGGKAIYGSSGTLSYYQRDDGTGNVRIISTPTRTLSSSVEIAPFGEDYDDNLLSGFTDFSFSNMGQESGTAGGVAAGYGAPYVTPNRRYSAVQGRWLSPDPIVGDNAYVYATNEPTIKSDPSGLQDGGDDCGDCLVFSWGDDGSDFSVGWGPDGAYGGWGSWGWGWFGGIWSQGPGGKNLKSLYSSQGYTRNTMTASLAWSMSTPMSSQGMQNSNAFPEIMATLVWWGMSTSMSSQGAQNAIAPDNFKPWDMRASLVALLRAKNGCSSWFNQGQGSAADIMSHVPILLGQPAPGPIPGPDAWTSPSPTSPIFVSPNGRFYGVSLNGLPVGGVFQPGSSGARTIILLHELAHKVDLIRSDAFSTFQSDQNTQIVMGHCAGTVP